MLQSKSFLKRTKKGNAIKVVQEHYLRDDIWCSVECCTLCLQTEPVLSTSALLTKQIPRPHYIVPDTNVFMNQIDVVEHPALHDVIVMQTVYEELRHLSLPIYNRLRALINDQKKRFYVFSNEHHRDTYIQRLKDESPNDRNDRAIRSAVKWYSTHLKKINKENHIEVVLLTDDVGNRTKAQEEGLSAFSVREYVEGMTDTPELVDVLENSSNVEGDKKVPYEEGSIFSNVDGVETQVMILGRPCLNRAIQGDVVAVQLLPKSEWLRTPTAVVVEEEEEANVTADLKEDGEPKEQNDDLESEALESSQPTGKVVGIIKRNWRPYCGFISKKSVKSSATSTFAENVLVIPMDRRIPYIYIRTRQAQNLMGQRILVSIDSWPKNSTALGAAGDKSTETEVLLLEHDVPFQEFAAQVLNDLPVEGEAWKVTEVHLPGRADLRHLNICSIDPPGCTDIDDALHVRPLPNGNYEVGVHIADVTHFVKPFTSMDEEAANRGTTVYLVNKRIDMLPELLGTNLCSLRSNVDRLAFSCIWELTPEAEIVNVNFTKSVISSKASLTYEEAQMLIDDTRKQDDLTKGIRILNQLAKKLHKKRLDRGAITLASPEVRFQLDFDSQDPVDVEMKELRETNALVEEFMLLANISVAEKIFSKFPASSLLRRHPSPTPTKLKELSNAINRFNFSLEFETSKALADSLDRAVIPDNPYFNKLLRILTTRGMMQAVYFCSGTLQFQDFRHYGLAAEIYTHFTSPIRRYSDVIVHRLLHAAINSEKNYGQELVDINKMQKLCDASRNSVELHTNIFFKGKIEQDEGYVTRVLKNGFIVLVPKYGIEGIVYSSSANSTAKSPTTPQVVYNPHNNSLESVTPSGTVSINLFDKVIVQITVDEDLVGGMRQKMKMELVSPFIPGLSVSDNNLRKKEARIDDEGGNGKRMRIDD
ncbi:13856_t:CDS:10 [Dentiscutata erythropus]|uniref:Ribosomal RNA-processing protein 44 n=1 Tax=Dentiscutata erythropus TaxID=1348616 RepID=A0A9N9NKP1_9GLOM|nr:13856_t:CDS:10 [Dentiscutata erythropus]